VNTEAIVEHDCQIEDHVHIATGAQLGVGVVAHQETHIGMGASIRQGITTGRKDNRGSWCCCSEGRQHGVIVVGVPARPLRTSDESCGLSECRN
jgi:acetyltransferase-like isoleucine patch superfamily enzyme